MQNTGIVNFWLLRSPSIADESLKDPSCCRQGKASEAETAELVTKVANDRTRV